MGLFIRAGCGEPSGQVVRPDGRPLLDADAFFFCAADGSVCASWGLGCDGCLKSAFVIICAWALGAGWCFSAVVLGAGAGAGLGLGLGLGLRCSGLLWREVGCCCCGGRGDVCVRVVCAFISMGVKAAVLTCSYESDGHGVCHYSRLFACAGLDASLLTNAAFQTTATRKRTPCHD